MAQWLAKTGFLLLMLVLPAGSFLYSVFRHGDLNVEYIAKWFWSNYLFMAAPHLLVMIFGWGGRARWHVLVFTLALLNVVLIAFQCWIWFVVSPGESGLAWVFYWPLTGITLITVMTYFGFKDRVKTLS